MQDFGDRFDAIDRRFDQFPWLVGGQATVLVTVVATLVAALFLR